MLLIQHLLLYAQMQKPYHDMHIARVSGDINRFCPGAGLT